MNSEYLVQKDMGSLLSIDILGDREQVCITTGGMKNYQNEVVFLVARKWTSEVLCKGLERCLWNRHWPWLAFRNMG
jgi:hypothetical protein